MFSSLQQSAEDIPAGEDKIVERRDGGFGFSRHQRTGSLK